MSWHDREGPWQAAVRKRARMFLMLVPMEGLFLGLPLWILRDAVERWMWMVLLGLCTAAVAFLLVVRRRILRIGELVPVTEGRCCRKCRLELTADRCPRCGRLYDVAALQRYWVDAFLKPRASLESWAAATAPGASRTARGGHALLLACRERPVLFVLASGVLWGTLIALSSLFDSRTMVGIGLQFLPMMAVSTGVGLIGLGLNRPAADDRRCAGCDYQLTPGDAHPTRCPECGTGWTALGGVVSGSRRGRRQGVLVVGGLMVLLAALLFVEQLASLRSGPILARVMPTAVLIEDLRGSYFSPDRWQELNTRTLTDRHVRRLAEGLLDLRDTSDMLSTDGAEWLTAQWVAGTLPDDLAERLVDGILQARLDVPATARVGQPCTVTLVTTYRRTIADPTPRRLEDLVVVDGFQVGDDPTWRSPGDGWMPPGILNLPEYRNSIQFTPDGVGPLRVRCALRWVIAPALAGSRWGLDPATDPPGGLASRRLEREVTIAVTP